MGLFKKKNLENQHLEDQYNKASQKQMPKIGDEPIKMSFWDGFKEYFNGLGTFLKSVIFRRIVLLIVVVIGVSGGVMHSLSHQKVYNAKMAATVSPINTQETFAISGTDVKFLQQYRTNNTYVLPFKIDDYTLLPSDAKNYTVRVQGVEENVSRKLKAKLMLFGTSGRGAIILDGKYTGKPVNIYLVSNKQAQSSDASETSDMDSDAVPDAATQGTTDDSNSSSKSDFSDSNAKAEGTMTVGGKDIKVQVDVVAVTVNPSAKNIKKVANLSYTSKPSEVYKIVLGDTDIATIDKNEKTAKTNYKKLLARMTEYEDRLKKDPKTSTEVRQAIFKVDKMAKTSQGSSEDTDKMDSILEAAGVNNGSSSSVSDTTDVSNMTEDEMEKTLSENVDMSNYGADDTSATQDDPVDVLSDVRTNMMTLNKKQLIYEYQRKMVGSIISQQDKLASVGTNYMLMPISK